jgi:antagonist of KipI
MTCRVIQPGLLTTVQDLGRFGHQHEGIPVAGAMDPVALRLANLLVGNEDAAAGLEITLTGPRLVFERPALIALAGADLETALDDDRIPHLRALLVPAGATISFGEAIRGCRTYLAIAGGIDVPVVLGSRSTYLRGAFGGVNGRALRRGDVLAWGEPTVLGRRIAAAIAGAGQRVRAASWGASSALIPRYSGTPTIRLLVGEHMHLLTPAAREQLFSAELRVGAQSDRMGYRLEDVTLALSEPVELLSEAVAFGTVQLPPSGNPIVLMADRQTTGGYPRLGEVATADLPLLAQLRPGDRLRFAPASLAEAEARYLAWEGDLAQARAAIGLRHR